VSTRDGVRSVLCYGDSNTWGYVASTDARLDWPDRWPGVLQSALGERVHVVEEGLSGRTTMFDVPGEASRNGLDTLPVALETHAPLDVVLLALGVNDLFLPGITARWVARGVEALVLAARTGGWGPGQRAPSVVVVVPPPVGAVPEEWTADAPSAREESEQLAAEMARVCDPIGVPLVDLAGVCEPSSVDGVHFEAEAHRQIGLAVAPQVRRLLEEPSADG